MKIKGEVFKKVARSRLNCKINIHLENNPFFFEKPLVASYEGVGFAFNGFRSTTSINKCRVCFEN